MSEHAKRPVCPEARFPVERAYVPEVNKLKQYLHDLTEYADSLESQLSDQKAMNDEVIKHARELNERGIFYVQTFECMIKFKLTPSEVK